MKNILLVTSEYPPFIGEKSGLGSHTRILANGLVRAGCNVVVVTYAESASHEIQDNGVRIFASGRYQAPEDSDYGAHFRALNDHVASEAKRYLSAQLFVPDVVHSQGSYGIYAAEALASYFSAPLIGTVHLLHDRLFHVIGAPAPAYLGDFDRGLCRTADELICVSAYLANEVMRFQLVAPERLTVIHNGIPLPPPAVAAPDAIPLPFGEGLTPARTILFVGRIVPQKGVESLLRSAVEVLQYFSDVRYRLIGSRKFDPDFSIWIDKLLLANPALEKSVEFLDPVPQDELWSFYRSSYMVVAPSLYESFGLVAVEAMLCRTPVIAASVGGLKEVITNQESGMLAGVGNAEGSPIDPGELAALQLKLLRDPALAFDLATRGFERALNTFSEQAMVERTLNCYIRTSTRFAAGDSRSL